ncbi:MAG: hypothetical protein PHT50_01370 [Candidatus Omnitrophica bacterium]|nr:hypothetical protein [Candidatus Omnitrophota bacterium]
MDRGCNGKNAYKPISKTRYYLGLTIFYLLHLNLKLTMFLRHYFIKKYPEYKILKDFHDAYFSQMLQEIRKGEGIRTNNSQAIHENQT